MSKNKKDTVTVRVGQLPGRVVEVTLPKGTTIAGAFESASIDLKSSAEITCNGQPSNLDQELTDNDTLLSIERIRGA